MVYMLFVKVSFTAHTVPFAPQMEHKLVGNRSGKVLFGRCKAESVPFMEFR